LRTRRTKKTSDQILQVADLRPSHARARTDRPGILQRVDEDRRLCGLGDHRRAQQRNADIGADIGEKAPEQAVRDFVDAAEAEQLLRPQQLDPEAAPASESRPGSQPDLANDGNRRV
jgi:hypothetical protein